MGRIKLKISIHYKEPKLGQDFALFAELNSIGLNLPEIHALKHETLQMMVNIKGEFTQQMEEQVKAVFLQRFKNVEDIQVLALS